MWFLRRMLHIAWTDKVSNKEVLQRANTSRNLLKVIVSRQIRFVWHIMRKSQLEATALTGIIEGKRARGRQRKTFTDWLSFACGEQWKINDIQKIYQDHNEHILIANIRFWHGTYIGLEWFNRQSIPNHWSAKICFFPVFSRKGWSFPFRPLLFFSRKRKIHFLVSL